jgi:UbiD family decarboxylase
VEIMKSLRDFVEDLEKENILKTSKKEVSLKYEMASVLKNKEDTPIMFERIKEIKNGMKAFGNIFATKDLVAKYLGVKKENLIEVLNKAIENPSEPKEIEFSKAPVVKNVMEITNLHELPIPIHTDKDGGPYIASGIIIANDKEYGRNCSFHRMMVIDKDKLVVRLLDRDLNSYVQRAGGELDVCIVIGSPINVLLASAISTAIDKDELTYANTMMPLNVVKMSNGISVPADAEFVFEAKITNEMHSEGPFVDLTETFDVVREQRIIKVNKIYHRDNATFHVLLPGGLEHKILMGMPREPTIFKEVNKVTKCTGVTITPGGCSWLHAIVSIDKQNENDGVKAIEAAFTGHKSLKHVVIVDKEIDIYNMQEVEWAIATRVQADKKVIIKPNQKGSSLDPSADPKTYITCKMGIDATTPMGGRGDYEKAKYLKIKIEDYV